MLLEQVLNESADWPLQTPLHVIKEFSAGLNHHTYLLGSDNQQYVLKIFSNNGRHEVAAQSLAAQEGLAPTIIYAQGNGRYMLMEYLPLECLADQPPDEELTPGTLSALAVALKALHETVYQAQTQQPFNILTFCEQYLTNAGDKAQRSHQHLLPLLKLFLNDTTPHCFCHNDLVRENCFVGHGNACFIDWEYADWHNPWFDVAAIVTYSELSRKQTTDFVASYNPQFSQRLREPILPAAQVALLWGDMLWHLDKFGETYWPKLERKWKMLKRLAAEQGINDV